MNNSDINVYSSNHYDLRVAFKSVKKLYFCILTVCQQLVAEFDTNLFTLKIILLFVSHLF